MVLKTCNRLRFISKTTVFYFISVVFFFSCALLSTINSKTPFLGISSLLIGKDGFHYQEFRKTSEKVKSEALVSLRTARAEWFLRGPGTVPPQCISKCGSCTPCKPVLVPIPPRPKPNSLEYKPEVWKCKCCGNIYNP